MSLIPEFEIGLWNAWILVLYAVLHPLIMILIDKLMGTGDMTKKMEYPVLSKTEQWVFIFTNIVLFLGLFIYSIFLPLKLGTAWFYTGLAFCLLGMIVWTTAIVNIADIPLGKPFTKGLYRYSRHPMDLASFLILLGAGIASASWLFLLLSIVLIVLSLTLIKIEERHCLEKFGDAYRDYMNRTSKWIGTPRSG